MKNTKRHISSKWTHPSIYKHPTNQTKKTHSKIKKWLIPKLPSSPSSSSPPSPLFLLLLLHLQLLHHHIPSKRSTPSETPTPTPVTPAPPPVPVPSPTCQTSHTAAHSSTTQPIVTQTAASSSTSSRNPFPCLSCRHTGTQRLTHRMG